MFEQRSTVVRLKPEGVLKLLDMLQLQAKPEGLPYNAGFMVGNVLINMRDITQWSRGHNSECSFTEINTDSVRLRVLTDPNGDTLTVLPPAKPLPPRQNTLTTYFVSVPLINQRK